MIIPVGIEGKEYDIILERGALQKAGEYLELKRKALIVTDDGVPARYAEEIKNRCAEPFVVRVAQGEGSKSFETLQTLLSTMLENGFSRGDCAVAVGGGVVGDLTGFAASVYMRGIDFYNIPTTVLSMVDSSVGGKTAINLDGIKNIVGSFHQPKKVIIDPDLLKTLPERQISSGMAEALKMSLTSDKELFDIFEKDDPIDKTDIIIEKALKIKSGVVEKDEKEGGLRRILNFGHTIGHGIESFEEFHGLYHGECVALGMIPMCSKDVRQRLIPVLEKLKLPVKISIDPEKVYAAMLHDKKAAGDKITVTFVNEIGSFEMKKVYPEELKDLLYLIEKER